MGFTSGVVLVVEALELKDSSPLFRYSRDAVSHLSFSHDSLYMATSVGNTTHTYTAIYLHKCMRMAS